MTVTTMTVTTVTGPSLAARSFLSWPSRSWREFKKNRLENKYEREYLRVCAGGFLMIGHLCALCRSPSNGSHSPSAIDAAVGGGVTPGIISCWGDREGEGGRGIHSA